MSYEIIKSITFDENHRRITLRSSSNNVTPKTYDLWSPTDHGCDYGQWKERFAHDLFDGIAVFQPSCESKAHKAFKLTNRSFGMRHDDSPWRYAYRLYTYDLNPDTGRCEYKYRDEELKAKYDEFESQWEITFLAVLDDLLCATRDGQLQIEFDEA